MLFNPETCCQDTSQPPVYCIIASLVHIIGRCWVVPLCTRTGTKNIYPYKNAFYWLALLHTRAVWCVLVRTPTHKCQTFSDERLFFVQTAASAWNCDVFFWEHTRLDVEVYKIATTRSRLCPLMWERQVVFIVGQKCANIILWDRFLCFCFSWVVIGAYCTAPANPALLSPPCLSSSYT